MTISLSIMDTGFKRYLKIETGEHKDYTKDVLALSIVDQTEIVYQNGKNIVLYLFNKEKQKDKLSIIDKWFEQTGYVPKRILCQQKIVKTLYKNKKYYLD